MTELPGDENTPRILIVEDEPKLGQLLIDYLQAAGYAPALINHGDKVLPYVRQTPPHLIPAGSDAARYRRSDAVPGNSPLLRCSGGDGDGENRRDRPFAGAGNRRRRLYLQALQPPGSGRPGKTILRRCKPQRDLQALDAQSPLIVDEGRFQASWRDKLLDLTPAEFRLLKTLSQEPGKCSPANSYSTICMTIIG